MTVAGGKRCTMDSITNSGTEATPLEDFSFHAVSSVPRLVETPPCYSAKLTPEPPISFGTSFIFGNPSLMCSFLS